jgi:hypothetical protein
MVELLGPVLDEFWLAGHLYQGDGLWTGSCRWYRAQGDPWMPFLVLGRDPSGGWGWKTKWSSDSWDHAVYGVSDPLEAIRLGALVRIDLQEQEIAWDRRDIVENLRNGVGSAGWIELARVHLAGTICYDMANVIHGRELIWRFRQAIQLVESCRVAGGALNCSC